MGRTLYKQNSAPPVLKDLGLFVRYVQKNYKRKQSGQANGVQHRFLLMKSFMNKNLPRGVSTCQSELMKTRKVVFMHLSENLHVF